MPGLISERAPQGLVPFYFAAAAALGDVVVVDTAVATTITPLGGAAKTSPATADLAPVLGVLTAAVAAGNVAMVCTYGPCTVKADASVNAANLPLFTVGTAGTAKTDATGTSINRIGFSTAAQSGGFATAFVQLGGAGVLP